MCVCNWVRDRQTKWHFGHLNQSASYAILFFIFFFDWVTPLFCLKINNLYSWFISCGKSNLKYILLSLSLQQLLSMRYKSLYARLPALFFALQNNIFMMLFTSWNRKQTEHANKHFTQNAALKGREDFKPGNRCIQRIYISVCLSLCRFLLSLDLLTLTELLPFQFMNTTNHFFSFHCVYAMSAKMMKMLSVAICWE